jgi:lipoprotein-anchoring transpeptidase ErfK/SrfK
MRRRFVLFGVAVAIFAGALLLLTASSADASTVRDRIMAKRAARGWDCSSGDCVLPAGGRRAESTTTVAPLATASRPVERSGAKQIEISLSEQRLRAFEGGQLVLDTSVSTGNASHPTPAGSFSVLSKEQMHWSSQYGAWMPYAMRVVGGAYMHETPIGADGRRIGASEIGSPASHGCIRVPSGAAQQLFAWADIGTPVVIY